MGRIIQNRSSQDAPLLPFLLAEVPRDRGCRDGEGALDRRDGRLCVPAGVQQHRGHDPAVRAVKETHQVHQQADTRGECVVIIRVDKEKGYIDLSKRRVSPEDIEKCEEKFAKARAVNSILRHVAEILKYETDEELENLYKKTAWHFDEKFKKHATSYEIFKHAVNDPSILDECELDPETKETLLANIKRRLTPQAVRIRSDIEVACYGYEGIDAVKNALRAGINCSTEEMPIKINLIAPPLYVCTTTTMEKADGLKALQDAIAVIEKTIKASDGVFNVLVPPKVVTDLDEAELARQLDKLEMQNAEVSGDSDMEDSDEEKKDNE